MTSLNRDVKKFNMKQIHTNPPIFDFSYFGA
ncbi:hypothetical protein [Coxiella burnetii]|nr:hypothetical protein [Coxiella burnetii]ATN66749.1 hypothetical protein AYM17_04930 [Coxiella burnetii]OYK86076.1 hypothetical protein CbuQ229_05155 [Coxiella burnetii]